jgi:apolipoprotein N-acyltransferase
MWEDEMHENYSILMIKGFMKDYPQTSFVIGADTRMAYYEGRDKSSTARPIGNTEHYYDIFNTALQIDNQDEIQIYHKSRLVPGVEMLPYPKLFWWLEDLMLDLGGMSGSHGTQKERTVFHNNYKEIKVGVPICYESVYGEFVGEWVNNGANIIFVITNDGWWEDTPGYRQHHSYSRIRAIETRRSIARSANTGISSFINQRGDVIEYLGWEKRGAIRQKLNANDKITFYVKYGDFFARMSLVVSAIFLIVQLLNFFIRKVKHKDTKTV